MLRSRRVAGVSAVVVFSAITAAGVWFGSTGRSDGTTMEVAAADLPEPDPTPDGDCAKRLVAGGDGVVNGNDASGGGSNDKEKSYAYQLLDEHLEPSPGPWCLWNTASEKVTTGDYRDDGDPTQQSIANGLRPDLITLTLGRENSVLFDHVDTCLNLVRQHDFIEANACAVKTLASQEDYDDLRDDLSEILQGYRVQQDGNPNLIVAVTGYFNPYPAATGVITKIPGFCADLQDTIPTCLARWLLLPPALVILDQIVQKLNTTIENTVHEFEIASQGRFLFVNPYEQFKDHCMRIDVEIKTVVYHPTNDVHKHDSDENFGCDEEKSWIAPDGETGTKTPFLYLSPAVTGVLLVATQTTENMGLYPNAKGHDCISDLIWEAVKIKLGVPEPPAESVCEGDE